MHTLPKYVCMDFGGQKQEPDVYKPETVRSAPCTKPDGSLSLHQACGQHMALKTEFAWLEFSSWTVPAGAELLGNAS